MPGGKRRKKEASTSRGDAITAPNRKKYEDEMEAVMSEIKEKDALLKNMQRLSGEQIVSSSNPDIAAELKRVSTRKRSTVEKIQDIDGQMKDLAQQVSKKRDLASQLMAGLPYRNEERFDAAVSKLQDQLHSVEYTPSEEKRLRSEVESLQKGKKSVKEYLDLKTEIDELRDKQTDLRKKRDDHYKEEDSVKQLEITLRQRQTEQRRKQVEAREKAKEEAAKRDELKKEIDCLYDKRRELINDFRKQQEDYLSVTRLQRDAERTQRQEEAKRKEEERQTRQKKERGAVVPFDPYKQQKVLIGTLMSYLNRMTLTAGINSSLGMTDSSGDDDNSIAHVSHPKWEGDQTQQGSFLQKKSDLDDKLVPTGGKRKSKRKKAAVVSKISKSINHTPTVFGQFHHLGMMAPTTYADIPSAITTLQAKLHEYNHVASQPVREPSEVDSQLTDDDISHTTEELLLDNHILKETTEDDVSDSGTSSPSKPDLIDTNS